MKPWRLVLSSSGSHRCRHALCVSSRRLTIPSVERLTGAHGEQRRTGSGERRPSFTGGFSSSAAGDGTPLLSNAYIHVKGAKASPSTKSDSAFVFPLKDDERGLLDRGVSAEAKHFIAEAEAQYRASSAYLHEVPGGPGMPETRESVDQETGALRRTTRVAAPFGEMMVPSSQSRRVVRGSVGELDYQQATKGKYLLDEHSQLRLKKERQLDELLASPMPLLEKAEEVTLLLAESLYPQGLALQPRMAETVMMLLGQASLRLRLQGRTREAPQGGPLLEGAEETVDRRPAAVALPSVPFFEDMRLLYARQKASFAAPTPLTVEYLMTACSAVTEPNRSVFHLANRLLLDCDKFVVLPTRTAYAAFFAVCRANNAVVPFAVARLKDAVTALHVSLDAPMATELLRGLNEGGYVEEAVALLARLEGVPLTTPLLNASLETLLLSREARSCFSAYESVRAASLKPDADTYTLLLLACEQSGDWGRVTRVLAEMQQRKVRGNAQTLNLLLKGLLVRRLTAYALQLHRTMKDKKVEVWPALEHGVEALQQRKASRQFADRRSGEAANRRPSESRHTKGRAV